jgi:adenylate cyclase
VKRKGLPENFINISITVGIAALLMELIVFWGPGGNFLFKQELRFQDWLLVKSPKKPLPENFYLLAMDEQSMKLDSLEPDEIAASPSLSAMKATGFPWSRTVYAEVVDRLREAGVKLIIFDIVFRDPKPSDVIFAESLKKFPNRVVIGSSFEPDDEGTMVLYTPPSKELAENATVGLANLLAIKDDIVRSVFLFATSSSFRMLDSHPSELSVPTMAVQANRLLGGKEIPIDLHPRRFPYSEELPSSRIIPFFEVLDSETWKRNWSNGAKLKDAVVLIGATDMRSHDYHPTPFGEMSGPEIQLHALAAVQRDVWLQDFSVNTLRASVILAAILAYLVVFLRRSMIAFVGILVGGAVFWVLIALAFLQWMNVFIPVVAPLSTWVLCGFVGLAAHVAHERKERRRLRGMWERHASKDMVGELLDNPESHLHGLVGERRNIAVLFCDLKGFTASAEDFDPAELVVMLNDYFGDMVAVVFEHSGMIDKFMGDALMASWGGLRTAGEEEDAKQSVRAAMGMKARLLQINKRRAEGGHPPWGCGTGICQGPAVFGNIGSVEKMDPTVIGDTVNLASRVEGLTRIYGCDVLIDQRLADFVRGEFDVAFVDEVRVKGRVRPEKLYHPYERHPDSLAWRDAFAEARIAYVAGDFETARKVYAELVSNPVLGGLATCYLKRCEGFIKDPPEGKWTGIWDFVSK